MKIGLSHALVLAGLISATSFMLAPDHREGASSAATAETSQSAALMGNPAPPTTTSPADLVSKKPEQQHPAKSCGENMDCLRKWFVEYKAAILSELAFWQQFEDDIARRSAYAALIDLRSAGEHHQYKHYDFDFYRGMLIKGVNIDDVETLIVRCRGAIINMKYMLIGIGHEYSLNEGDPGFYLRNVRACERRFKLPPTRSELRSKKA